MRSLAHRLSGSSHLLALAEGAGAPLKTKGIWAGVWVSLPHPRLSLSSGYSVSVPEMGSPTARTARSLPSPTDTGTAKDNILFLGPRDSRCRQSAPGPKCWGEQGRAAPTPQGTAFSTVLGPQKLASIPCGTLIPALTKGALWKWGTVASRAEDIDARMSRSAGVSRKRPCGV